MAPIIGKEDIFENNYKEKFRTLLRDHGVFVEYEKDLAALDMGLHMTAPEGHQHRVSLARIWFQLKGIHSETLPIAQYERATHLSMTIKLDHLKFWFASPEPIYLAVYVESLGNFIVEDVRDVVYRQWGEDFLAPGTFSEDQQEVTVKLLKDAYLTPERLALMRRHQSIRIDGPFFRGRPLGHRLDPLRCYLNKLDPPVFVALVERLLSVHNYRIVETLNPAELLEGPDIDKQFAVLTIGRLYNTFEWMPHLFTEFGTDQGDDFRIEATPQYAHGPVGVFIHGNPQSRPRVESLQAFAGKLLAKDIHRLLVFENTDELKYFGSFFGGLNGTQVMCMPQLLGDLGYNILTATIVYLEYRQAISWRLVNYL